MLSCTLALALLVASSAAASSSNQGIKVSLSHNPKHELARRNRDPKWLLAEAVKLDNKYGAPHQGRRKRDHRRRQNGAVQ